MHDVTKEQNATAAQVRLPYRSIREQIEDVDGGWNGGDVVELPCNWFTSHGFDVNGPNPYRRDEHEQFDERGADIPSDAKSTDD